MSCTSGSPCYNNQFVYSGCANDPCNPNSRISCDGIVYIGSPLPCTGIESCDTMCVALQKLDNAICNTPGFTVTASNGLYKDIITNDIRMGGPLTEQTVIGTSNINTLSITGLVNDLAPDALVSVTALGVLRQTSASSILSAITANNGLTKTGNIIQLSGPLIKPTTVTLTSTNTLSIPGLVTDNTETYLVSVDPTTGLLTKRSVASIVSQSTVNANNGLTNNAGTIQLGGSLTQPTTITTSSTNTLSIGGLDSNATPTGILTTNGSGVMTTTSLSALLNNLTANNGLTKSTATNVQLGGTLIQGTYVNLATYILSLKSTTTYNTGLVITPGPGGLLVPTWNNDRTAVTGKFSVTDYSWFQNNVGIGAQPGVDDPSSTNARLYVTRSQSGFNNSAGSHRSSINNDMVMTGSGTDTSNVEVTTSLITSLSFNFTANTNLYNNIEHDYTGIMGRFSLGGSNNTTVTGTAAAITSRGFFADNGGVPAPSGQSGQNLTTYIGFHAQYPQAYGGTIYSGTITNAIGVMIENQRYNIDDGEGSCPGVITNSYGVVQGSIANNSAGSGDVNKYNAKNNVFPNLVDAANDGAAASAGVLLWGLYRTGNTVKIRIV